MTATAGRLTLVRRIRDRVREQPGASTFALVAVLLLAFRQSYTVPYTTLGLPPAQLILLLLGVCWLLTRALGQRAPAGLGVLTGLVVVRAMFVLISYGLGVGRYLTADQQTASQQSVLTELGVVTTVIVLGTVLRNSRDVELVLKAICLGGAVSACYAIVEFGAHTDLAAKVHLPILVDTRTAVLDSPLLREGLSRPSGAAGVPLEFGAVMTVLIPVSASLFFAARRRGERGALWGVAALLMLGGGVVSLSRSVFVGLGVAFVVMVWRWPVRRALAVIGTAVAAVLIALLTGSKVVDAVSKLLTQGSGDYSLQSRSDGRSYVLAQFAHHFWFGQGPGTYDANTQPVLDNQYLGQLIETGVIGLIMFVAVLVCGLLYALRAASRTVAPDAAELANGLAGSLGALLVITAILDTSGFVQISTLQWMLVGLVGALWRATVVGRPPVEVSRPVVAAVH